MTHSLTDNLFLLSFSFPSASLLPSVPSPIFSSVRPSASPSFFHSLPPSFPHPLSCISLSLSKAPAEVLGNKDLFLSPALIFSLRFLLSRSFILSHSLSASLPLPLSRLQSFSLSHSLSLTLSRSLARSLSLSLSLSLYFSLSLSLSLPLSLFLCFFKSTNQV